MLARGEDLMYNNSPLIPDANQTKPPEEHPTALRGSPRQKLPASMWQSKPLPAFWTIASLTSILLNIILVVVLILLGRELFGLKKLVQEQLIGGLAKNFALMDQAVISTQVTVNDQIPVQFLLPISQRTTVVLTEDTWLNGARVNLATGGLSIVNAPTDILLPKGTPLQIRLEMDVPVDALIPVTLNVPVHIPLNETDLHHPFVGLQQVVEPYHRLLGNLPDSWEEVVCASTNGSLCDLFR